MPIINKPTYIPYKWNYLCSILFNLTPADKILIENDQQAPLSNPLRMVNLQELIDDKELSTNGLPSNYQSTSSQWFTYNASSPTDITFEPNPDSESSGPYVLRAFGIPSGVNVDETSFTLYQWDANNHEWVPTPNVGYQGETPNSITSSSFFANYKFFSILLPTSLTTYFAVKITPIS